jgi:hypothetical protein
MGRLIATVRSLVARRRVSRLLRRAIAQVERDNVKRTLALVA